MSGERAALQELVDALREAIADDDCPVVQPLTAWAQDYKEPMYWRGAHPPAERLWVALKRCDEALATQMSFDEVVG